MESGRMAQKRVRTAKTADFDQECPSEKPGYCRYGAFFLNSDNPSYRNNKASVPFKMNTGFLEVCAGGHAADALPAGAGPRCSGYTSI